MDLAADAAVFFDDLAEPAVYRPRGHPPRIVNVVVDRQEAASQSPLGLVAARMLVAVRNHPTEGIPLDTLDLAGDTIDLPVRDGTDPSPRAITGIVSQDAGILILEVM